MTMMASATGQTLVDLVDHLRGMESSFTTILFEAALKLASIADTSVFLLVETAEGRKFGGKRHLCDSYVGDGLKSLSNDFECSLDLSFNPLQQRNVGETRHQQPTQRQKQPSVSSSAQAAGVFTSLPSPTFPSVASYSAAAMIPDPQQLSTGQIPRLQDSRVGAGLNLFGNSTSVVAKAAFHQPDSPSLPSTISSQFSPASSSVNGGSSNKRKQSRPKSLLVNHHAAEDDCALPPKTFKTTHDGEGARGAALSGATAAGTDGGTRLSAFDNDDVIEIKEEPMVSIATVPMESVGDANFDADSCQILDNFRDNFKDGFNQGFEASQNYESAQAYEGTIVAQKKVNDFDGMVLDLLGGNQSVVVWNVREYLASNMKVSAMLTMEPLIDTHVDPSGRELKKHSAFMKMLSSILYDASKEAAIACPVKCKSDPSSKNFFSVVFEDLFAFFPNLNDLHVRGFRCPEGTRSYSVKTFCRNIMQRSFGFFLDKMR